MRLFVALDIDDDIRERISRFVEGIRTFAPDVRWARPESLHVTLKFIGERSEHEVEGIKRALDAVGGESLQLNFRGYGFFPGARAARVFWIGIEAGPQLGSLAAHVDGKLAALNIPKEEHAFAPHLTLARGKGGSGAPRKRSSDSVDGKFSRLQQKLAALPAPEFGTMAVRKFFLYQSQLSSGGSKYTKLAGFKLS
jgi:RNA 2',3'-cyclic 3'-phosphodiesterase